MKGELLRLPRGGRIRNGADPDGKAAGIPARVEGAFPEPLPAGGEDERG